MDNRIPEPSVILGLDDSYLQNDTITIFLDNVTLKDALEATLGYYGYSYVLESDVENPENITINFNQTPLKTAIKSIGTAADVEFRLDDDVIKVSTGGKQAVAVLSPMFGGKESASTIAKELGNDVTVANIEGNIVVAGDTLDVQRFEDVSKELHTRPPGQWRVVVWIIDSASTTNWSAGLSGDFGAVFSADGDSGGVVTAFSYSTELAAQLSAFIADSELITRSTLTLLENRPSTIGSTIQTPVPQRNVSPQGTVTTSGYTYVNAGLTVNLTGIPVPNGLEIKITPTISNIQGFIEEVPILTERKTQCSAIVRDGSVLVLSGMEELTSTTDWSMPIQFTRNSKDSRIAIIATFEELHY